MALLLAALNLRPSIASVPPLLGTIQEQLGISGAVVSLLTSLPVLCMGIFAPLAVKLNRRWGTEGTIMVALILIGAATALRFLAVTTSVLLMTSLLAGIGIAIAGPLLSGYIKRHFPNRASTMVGLYSTAMVLGAVLSIWLSVPLQTLFHGSWNASLGIWALVAVIALPIWVKLAAATKREAPLQAGPAVAERLPLTTYRAWVLMLFFGFMAAVFYSVTTWFAPVVQSMGYSKSTAANIQSVLTLISLPATLLIPMGMQRFHGRLWWLLGCSVLELVGVLMLIFHVNPWLAAIPLGIGTGGLFPIALILPIQETGSPREANAWSAMAQSGGYILGAAGPFVMGRIHDVSDHFAPALYVLAGIVVLQIAVQLIIGNKAPVGQKAVSGS
ncbi:MFS transporter [Paenibacillus filicis]|uniref:MFS transporter n=1 Tax=Paenibacillus filicis TaxID=669464 RepID=A0ABU9DRX3_9BACL